MKNDVLRASGCSTGLQPKVQRSSLRERPTSAAAGCTPIVVLEILRRDIKEYCSKILTKIVQQYNALMLGDNPEQDSNEKE